MVEAKPVRYRFLVIFYFLFSQLRARYLSNEVTSSRYILMIWSLIVCVLADKNWKNKHFLCMISLYFWELKIRIDIGIACSELNFFPWPRGIILCMKCYRRFALLRLCDSPNVSKCFLWIIFFFFFGIYDWHDDEMDEFCHTWPKFWEFNKSDMKS